MVFCESCLSMAEGVNRGVRGVLLHSARTVVAEARASCDVAGKVVGDESEEASTDLLV